MITKTDIEHEKMPRAEVKEILLAYINEPQPAGSPPRPRMSRRMVQIMTEDNIKW
jgi:hypothetical protein